MTYLDEVLQSIAGRKDIWATTTGEIAAWWKDQSASISPR
jgi:hypothetical protein